MSGPRIPPKSTTVPSVPPQQTVPSRSVAGDDISRSALLKRIAEIQTQIYAVEADQLGNLSTKQLSGLALAFVEWYAADERGDRLRREQEPDAGLTGGPFPGSPFKDAFTNAENAVKNVAHRLTTGTKKAFNKGELLGSLNAIVAAIGPDEKVNQKQLEALLGGVAEGPQPSPNVADYSAFRSEKKLPQEKNTTTRFIAALLGN